MSFEHLSETKQLQISNIGVFWAMGKIMRGIPIHNSIYVNRYIIYRLPRIFMTKSQGELY